MYGLLLVAALVSYDGRKVDHAPYKGCCHRTPVRSFFFGKKAYPTPVRNLFNCKPGCRYDCRKSCCAGNSCSNCTFPNNTSAPQK